MEEPSFEAEINEFLGNIEKESTPDGMELLDVEMSQIVDAFYDHVIAYQECNLSNPDELATAQQNILKAMADLDIPWHIDRLRGDLQVLAGEGVVFQPDDDGFIVDATGRGDVFRGVFSGFTVMSIPAAGQVEAFMSGVDDEPANPWGLSIILTDAAYIDRLGVEKKLEGTLILPVVYEDTRLYRVASVNGEQKSSAPDITDIFRNKALQESFSDIENDLNYNLYTLDKVHRLRREYQAKLEEVCLTASDTDTFQLTCPRALLLSGGERVCMDVAAEYLNPTIIQIAGFWRVAYGFSDCGGTRQIFHVLPEDIECIRLQL